jgi:16S rRNA (uracil1498-N3)-methyltransferase
MSVWVGMAATVRRAMAKAIRLHCAALLAPGAAIPVDRQQAHYLARVMRLAAGDTVRLFNGHDGEWAARIERLDREPVLLALELLRAQTPEPDLWLLAAPLRRELTELVVQKATELGASRILPVLTARSNPQRANPQRLRAIAVEAAEQCERLTVPAIEAPAPLASALAGWDGGRLLVAAAERAQAAPPPRCAGRAAALLVGPEGGFTPAELDGLAASPFVVLASLGPRILRAETAAIVGLALMQAPWPPSPP